MDYYAFKKRDSGPLKMIILMAVPEEEKGLQGEILHSNFNAIAADGLTDNELRL